MNPGYEAFADSVHKAFKDPLNPYETALFIFTFGAIFAFGFFLSWLYSCRRRARRAFTYFLHRLRGVVSADSRRYDFEAPLAIILPLASHPTARSFTVNLSAGGMYIKTKEPFAVSTSFDFHLELPGDERVDGIALVRWVKPFSNQEYPAGMGVEFVHISSQDQNRIRAYLKRRKWKKL